MAAPSDNEVLRGALRDRRVSVDVLAKQVGVDPKTVERWLGGRVPYRAHQEAVAEFLGLDPVDLWPSERRPLSGSGEVMAVWPNRRAAPPGLWADTLRRATTQVDVLVYAGFWLSEDPVFREVLAGRAAAGVKVRVLLGDPASEEVARRSEEEQLGAETIGAKIRNTLVNYRDLVAGGQILFRLHSTTLYNSIFRADDVMLVNPHIYGQSAYVAPIFQVQRADGGSLFGSYLASLERVWASSLPVDNNPEEG